VPDYLADIGLAVEQVVPTRQALLPLALVVQP
jgi:hypothetical protein